MCPSHAFWRNVKTPKISANFLGRPGVQWACFGPTWPTRKSDVCFCLKAILSEFAKHLCPVLWIFWGITIQVNSNSIFIEVASYKKRLLLMYRKIPFPDSAVPQAANFANYAKSWVCKSFARWMKNFTFSWLEGSSSNSCDGRSCNRNVSRFKKSKRDHRRENDDDD